MAVDTPPEAQGVEHIVLPHEISDEQPRKGISDMQRMRRELTFVSKGRVLRSTYLARNYSWKYSVFIDKMPWPFHTDVHGNGISLSRSVELGDVLFSVHPVFWICDCSAPTEPLS